MEFKQWQGFEKGSWVDEINVSDFILNNYTLYDGDESFLCGATERTQKMMDKLNILFEQEKKSG